MQPDYMQETMKNLYGLWTRPVNVATVLDGERRIVCYDGKEFKSTLLSELPVGEQNEKASEEG
jgi:stage V sporulation protein R